MFFIHFSNYCIIENIQMWLTAAYFPDSDSFSISPWSKSLAVHMAPNSLQWALAGSDGCLFQILL